MSPLVRRKNLKKKTLLCNGARKTLLRGTTRRQKTVLSDCFDGKMGIIGRNLRLSGFIRKKFAAAIAFPILCSPRTVRRLRHGIMMPWRMFMRCAPARA